MKTANMKHKNEHARTSLSAISMRSFSGSGLFSAKTMQFAPIASKMKYSKVVRLVKEVNRHVERKFRALKRARNSYISV